jgi:hypothetical protein
MQAGGPCRPVRKGIPSGGCLARRRKKATGSCLAGFRKFLEGTTPRGSAGRDMRGGGNLPPRLGTFSGVASA